MSDAEIRTLERTPTDPLVAYRLRAARIRAGERVPFLPGDKIRVRETESPWVRSKRWTGIVRRVFEAGDAYVRPIGRVKNWGCRPSKGYLAEGLYLTQGDMAASTLLVPVRP